MTFDPILLIIYPVVGIFNCLVIFGIVIGLVELKIWYKNNKSRITENLALIATGITLYTSAYFIGEMFVKFAVELGWLVV